MYLSHLSKWYPSNHTYLAYPYLHHQHHPNTPTMFQYQALPSTISRYILPIPPSYYHSACLLRPCSVLISSLDSFSMYCLTICNNDYGVNIGQVTSSRLCRRCTNLRILSGISGVSRNKQKEGKISILGSQKSKKVTKILHSHQ